jgi:hypothetical protein
MQDSDCVSVVILLLIKHFFSISISTYFTLLS